MCPAKLVIKIFILYRLIVIANCILQVFLMIDYIFSNLLGNYLLALSAVEILIELCWTYSCVNKNAFAPAMFFVMR